MHGCASIMKCIIEGAIRNFARTLIGQVGMSHKFRELVMDLDLICHLDCNSMHSICLSWVSMCLTSVVSVGVYVNNFCAILCMTLHVAILIILFVLHQPFSSHTISF